MLQVILVAHSAVHHAPFIGSIQFFNIIISTSRRHKSRLGTATLLRLRLLIIMGSEIVVHIDLLVIVFTIDVEAQLLLNRLGSSVVNWVISLTDCVVDLGCDLVI